MSAPDTNLDKQKRKHAVPLIAMIGGLALAAILLISLLFFVTGPEDGAEVDATEGGVGVLAAPPSADGVGDDDDIPEVD